MNKWIVAKVTAIKHWTETLFTLHVEAPVSPFMAGQFTKLGFQINNKCIIQRAYSFVNAPSDKNLEFYLVTVKGGHLSTYLHALSIGDEILIAKDSAGFFVIHEIPSCNNLWMLATGTAIGPYLSILQEGKDLERFANIVLVHAVRYQQDMCYLPLMRKLQQKYREQLYIQTIVSREKVRGSLLGHIPTLISNGTLEHSLGLKIQRQHSHIMLCGNPNMVRSTQDVLKNTKNMKKHLRRGPPGHISTEHYW
ncbi:MAG: ferredoxin--NADP(+) reductase [Candidatus Dasytiphilus stammeri]